MSDVMYTDKCFAKLMLNNKIIRANDKLHPASLKNWRRILPVQMKLIPLQTGRQEN